MMKNSINEEDPANNSISYIRNKTESLDSGTDTFNSRKQSIESYVLDSPLKHKGHVSFGRICIREYSICLGDNPSCSSGPPLCMSWNYNDIGSVDVEEFEMMRPPRRYYSEMIIPSRLREEILYHAGHSVLEISDAVKSVALYKSDRKKNLRSINVKINKLIERSSKIMKW